MQWLKQKGRKSARSRMADGTPRKTREVYLRWLSCLGVSREVQPRKSRRRVVPKQWRRGEAAAGRYAKATGARLPCKPEAPPVRQELPDIHQFSTLSLQLLLSSSFQIHPPLLHHRQQQRGDHHQRHLTWFIGLLEFSSASPSKRLLRWAIEDEPETKTDAAPAAKLERRR